MDEMSDQEQEIELERGVHSRDIYPEMDMQDNPLGAAAIDVAMMLRNNVVGINPRIRIIPGKDYFTIGTAGDAERFRITISKEK